MKPVPRITKILKIEPFKVTLLWNNSEVRETDFSVWFQKWEQNSDISLLRLKNYDDFKQVTLSEQKTLEWANLPVEITFKGQKQSFSLELDPDVLYQNSQLIRQIEHLSIGSMFRKARLDAGLSQEEVALNSGTTRHYISRIENEQSSIQLDTFQKIIELGLGRKIKLEII
jgi:DNA-binding XRE family transcriptional regulator